MYRKVIAIMLAAALAAVPAGTAVAEEIIAEGDMSCDAAEEVCAADAPEQIAGEVPDGGLLVDDGAVIDGSPAANDGAVIDGSLTANEGAVIDGSSVADDSAADGSPAANDGAVIDGSLTADDAAADGSPAANEGAVIGGSLIADDSLILDIEEVTLESDLAVDDTVIADEVWTAELSESGLADDACASLFRTYSARSAYVDSYGGQLDGDPAALYSALVNTYMTERGCGELKYTLSEPLTFSVPDGVIVQEDGHNKLQWDSKNNAEYQDAVNTLRYIVQASYDAVIYDYPEIFWMSAPKFQWTTSFSGTAGSYNGKIATVIWKPVDKYEGASAQISAFDAAVQSTYEQLNASLNGDVSSYNIVKVIHDYLCDNLVYENSPLAHTAAGVFLQDDKRVVCEGYAKSFMILCRRFGLESVLVPGGAKTSNGVEGHMWNYVKMEDGKWYLVDATWDDQKTSISDKYFLAGNQSVGFRGTTLYEERESNRYANFSGSEHTFSFSFPTLSECKYHTEHTWGAAEHIDETCTTASKESRACTVAGCDAVDEKVNEGTTLGHDFASEYTIDQKETCEEAGRKSRHCSRCDAVTDEQEIPAPGHDFATEYETDRKATCKTPGQESRHCSRCDAVTDVREIPASGHEWDAGKITAEPTCEIDGVKTFTCSRCKETKTETVKAPGHKWDAGKITAEPTCDTDGVKTFTCSSCGKTRAETVKAPGHDFAQEFTIDQAPTCELGGSKSRHCSRCSAATEVTTLPMSGHKYGRYTVESEPTALAEGRKVRSCQVCGDIQSELLPRLKSEPELNVKSLKLKTGQSTTAVKVSGLAQGDSVVSWQSSKPKTVRVTKSGKITGRKVGSAVVTVTLASGRTAELKVKVQKKAVRTTKISGLPGQLALQKGQKVKLRPMISPITSLQKVKYHSSNKRVAAVSSKGTITAKKAGKAKITVRSGSKKKTVTVIVS